MRFKIFVWVLLILLVVFAGYKLYPFFAQKNKPDIKASKPPLPENKEPGMLFAVVVENLPDARPQSGFSQAEFVFETLTESGITRFLAFFGQDQDISKIGPVRSARPYFIDWATGFGSVLVHSGASLEAESRIEELGDRLFDLNEFFNETYFWRDAGKKPPHNLFTSTELLNQAVFDENRRVLSGIGWAIRRENKEISTSTVRQIEIDFSYPQYFVTFQYDAVSNVYMRFIASKSDVDAETGKQIEAKNVAILYTTSRVIDQKLLTIDLQTLGSGRAVIFRDGQAIQARWKKDRADAPLRLLEADDSLIELNPGLTWIGVLDQYGNAVWK